MGHARSWWLQHVDRHPKVNAMGQAFAWGMARRRPPEYWQKVDADDWFETLECFAVLLYDRTSRQSRPYVDEEQKVLFIQKGREIDLIPHTKAALLQHIRRAVYQAVHCWSQMLVCAP